MLAVALITYCIWRFWEAITGQGADAAFGNMKNFFRYRLSPFVSGVVYALYTIFVITLIPKSTNDRRSSASNSSFPDSWSHTTAGKFGLCIAGIAFIAGDGSPYAVHMLFICVMNACSCTSNCLVALIVNKLPCRMVASSVLPVENVAQHLHAG